MKNIIKYGYFFIIMLIPVMLYPHDEYPVSAEKTVREADTIVTAIVDDIVITEKRCSTTTSVLLSVRKVLHGAGPLKKNLIFYRTSYEWKPAKYFWQEDCPSMNYTVPPMPDNINKGDEVIATIKSATSGEENEYVSGILSIDKYETLGKILKKNL